MSAPQPYQYDVGSTVMFSSYTYDHLHQWKTEERTIVDLEVVRIRKHAGHRNSGECMYEIETLQGKPLSFNWYEKELTELPTKHFEDDLFTL